MLRNTIDKIPLLGYNNNNFNEFGNIMMNTKELLEKKFEKIIKYSVKYLNPKMYFDYMHTRIFFYIKTHKIRRQNISKKGANVKGE